MALSGDLVSSLALAVSGPFYLGATSVLSESDSSSQPQLSLPSAALSCSQRLLVAAPALQATAQESQPSHPMPVVIALIFFFGVVLLALRALRTRRAKS